MLYKTGERKGFVEHAVFLEWTALVSVPATAPSKAWVFGRSTAEIVGSNPTGGHGCLSVVSVVCCQLEVSATR